MPNGYVEECNDSTYTVKALNLSSITEGVAKTAFSNGVYDQLTAKTAKIENGKKTIKYTIEADGKTQTKEYNYSSFNNFNGDIVYGLILTGIPENIDVTVTSVIE